ncbi:MAG: hypothetical protein Q4D12_07480 [Bacteroidales bacterium]|nr:hypothetical protein [Bacteroidales bacterium]
MKEKIKAVGSVLSLTTFLENGMIVNDPLDGEYIELPNALCGKFSAKMEVTRDGMCITERKPKGMIAQERYHTAFRSTHSKVKITKEDVIIELRFPKRWGNKKIVQTIMLEIALVKAFFHAQKNSTNF